MTKRMNNIHDLPKWFDLEKYRATAELKADEWAQELTYRVKAFEQGAVRETWDWFEFIEKFALITKISKEDNNRILDEAYLAAKHSSRSLSENNLIW